MIDLLTSSGTALARLIRTRAVTSREVVEAHIARIERVNPVLNAVVAPRFATARAEADRADARVRDAAPAELPPLHGVPCTIKEAIALEGMPYTSGLVARVGRTAPRDATGTARLRAAGAIPLGVTNCSELCMWMESANRVYGRSNNPYDPRRTVGGSSGGEGAIVAACGAPFGLGADVGGSIRMPAYFNGVFGHKPTGGLIPNTGHFPLAHGLGQRYLTTGPIARRAEDLWPLVRILAGPDGEDGGARALPLGDPAAVRLDELDVLVVEENGAVPVHADLRYALWRAADALGARGARVRRARFTALARSFDIWAAMLGSVGGPSFASLMGEGTPVRPWRELARWLLGRSPHTFPAIGLAALEGLSAAVPARQQRALALGAELHDELTRTIGPSGVLLYPPYPTTAPRHNAPLWPPFNWVYTAIFNVMQLPVTVAPLGLDGAGLPLGVQIAGIEGNDHVTIAVAQALEQALGGWVPPGAVLPA
ncbi:MAG TPA: amidase [Polyangia bacterium]